MLLRNVDELAVELVVWMTEVVLTQTPCIEAVV